MEKNNKILHLYPIDYPFETLVSRADLNQPKLILNPDFQRKYKWDKDGNERASRFIESCLMRIPLPACYFAERDDGTHLVIDGVQRITTIINFFGDKFPLEGLTIFKELEGKKFSELGDYKNELESTTIRCIILRKENNKELITEIFARLNQGAVQLSAQEIRHAIYPGNLDDLIIELSKIDFIQKFGLGANATREKDSREDEEMILRFFAMQTDLSDYEGRLAKYMDKYMAENQNIELSKISELKDLFTNTLQKCLSVFGETVFTDTNRERPKQGLVYYDLLMYSFKAKSGEFLEQNKIKIQDLFKELCADPEFLKSISGGLSNKSSILKRRELWNRKLSSIND
ncbi:MAG: DUF262 domain-containing protein [Leptospiraceae bacterium]|nr:DUF262 domain-containing protein [Leptospiraceae bacterium]